MRTRTILITGAVAAAMVAASAVAALAAPATVGHWANVYANPGSGIVATVAPGDYVQVVNCTSSYCFIHRPGPDGWVKKWALDFYEVSYPGYWNDDDYGGIRVCASSVAASICVGD
jgi:hypothetical protein